jgi:two-component system sensor histidine kinase/response regulator
MHAQIACSNARVNTGVPMGQVLSAISFAELLSRVDEDREFMDELLTLFSEELSPLMRTLDRAVVQVDLRQVETAAHTLAGMLANLSASQARSSAAALEQLGRKRQSAGLATALAILRQDLEEVTASVRLHLEESPA